MLSAGRLCAIRSCSCAFLDPRNACSLAKSFRRRRPYSEPTGSDYRSAEWVRGVDHCELPLPSTGCWRFGATRAQLMAQKSSVCRWPMVTAQLLLTAGRPAPSVSEQISIEQGRCCRRKLLRNPQRALRDRPESACLNLCTCVSVCMQRRQILDWSWQILGGSLTRTGCGMDHGFRKAREDS